MNYYKVSHAHDDDDDDDATYTALAESLSPKIGNPRCSCASARRQISVWRVGVCVATSPE